MTPREQRIAIAETCGAVWETVGDVRLLWFKPTPYPSDGYPRPAQETAVDMARRSIPFDGVALRVPDYLVDLNAMHEAEKVLTGEQWKRYTTELYDVCDEGPNIPDFSWQQEVCATAAQRAEAFCRTLWPDRFK